MKVQDIMTKNVLTVLSGDPIDHVVNIMVENKIHGVPVVRDGKLIGMVTETDFFSKDSVNFNLASFIEVVRKNRTSGVVGMDEKINIQKLITSTIDDIMSKNCITISQDDDIEKLIELFRKTGFSKIPVVDKNSDLVGIITRSDVIRTMKI